jgi:hypothetical protein
VRNQEGFLPMMSPGLARAARKLEDLPSDGRRAVDTLAGANLRIFIRLNELEEVCKRLGRRLAVLEAQKDPGNGTSVEQDPDRCPRTQRDI